MRTALVGPQVSTAYELGWASLSNGELLAVPFGVAEVRMAAHLYRVVPRARRRELDLCIAACALTHGASLWTMNAEDFRDIPDLELYAPARA